MAISIITIIAIAGIFLVIRQGFRQAPESFRESASGENVSKVDIPESLPDLVKKHIRTCYGDTMPEVNSAIYWGTGSVRFMNTWLPVRFKTWSRPGFSFYRYVEVLWFGLPVLKGHEMFENGSGKVKYSGIASIMQNGLKSDVSQFLAMWVETLITPSAWIDKSRVSWNANGRKKTCQMLVPIREGIEQFSVSFNTKTGLVDEMATLRYRGDGPRIPWTLSVDSWKSCNNIHLPDFRITWSNDSKPFLIASVEGIACNADISKYLDAPPRNEKKRIADFAEG